MSFFPQVGPGAVAQFPFGRTRKWRAITNALESGEQIILPDSAGGQVEWDLSYVDISDVEVAAISDLFTATQGCFGSFTFIDPLANLLGWSEDLSRPDWAAELLLTTSGIADPTGSQRASALSNASAGTQLLSQTLGISGDYVACFSAYVRSDAAGTITMQRDSAQMTAAIGSNWKRVFVSGAGTTGVAQSTFALVVGAGQTVDVWGLQVEAQPYPSAYKQTAAANGVYEETYFDADELTVTSVGVGLSSSRIKLISRV